MKRSESPAGVGRTKWQALGGAFALLLLLALAGCGSDGNGSGGGANTVTVVVSPTAAAAVLNQTIPFSVQVSGAPTVDIVMTNGAVRASNIVTITTAAAHNLMAGNTASVSGTTDLSFIGQFTVATVPSSTTFTYQQNGVDSMSGSGRVANVSVQWFVNDVQGGNAANGLITTAGVYTAPAVLPMPATATIATTNGVVRASGVVTVTTTAAHNFVVNQIVQISGVTDPAFNTTATVITSVPSTTTFTYTQGNLANAMSGGGTVSSTAVKIKAQSVVDTEKSATAIVSLDSGVTVRVLPPTAQVGTGETFQFSATVTGNTNQAVSWQVNEIAGGNTTVGTIDANGLYTAPATPPSSVTATIAASGAVRSNNIVTITTTANHSFFVGQVIQITGVTDASFNGNFSIASVPNSTSFTYAQNGANATSGGGTAGLATSSVSIRALSAVDASRFGVTNATIVAVSDPTLNSISPTTAAQGSVFVDVYLTGSNFLSTTTARVNGTPVGTALVSATLIRARVPENLLTSLGTLQIDAQRQNGTTTAAFPLTVEPVRPALVGTSPDSAVQTNAGVVSVNFNGGYYSGSIVSEFNGDGQIRGATLSNSRQLSVVTNAGDLSQAGLFPVTVRNSAATPPLAAVNFAVQPNAIPSIVNTVAVGTQPSAVAINTATGTAVVANRGSNSITLIDLVTNTPSGPFALAAGASPTGVGVDNQRNLAVTANNGNDTISFVDLATGAVTLTLSSPTPSGAAGPLKPFSVGVNSLTGLALVANQSTNTATILDLTTNPPSVVGTVTNVGTGTTPQVSIEPKLNWAVVTPGGAGAITIVDLTRRAVVATVSAGVGIRGIGINTETERALLVDPSSMFALQFSVLDQSVSAITLELGYTAAAVNPLTNVGVVINPTSNQIRVIDLQTPLAAAAIGGGTTPRALAIDPVLNVAVIVNEGSNDASILALGMLRPLQVTEVGPGNVIRAAGDMTDATLTVTGSGFDGTSVVRLDGTPVTTTLVSSRRLIATVPAAMMATPRRYAVDVLNAGPVQSNVTSFAVIVAVPVGTAPKAVAIDDQRNLAVVANSGSDNASVVDLATGMVSATITVGDNPQGVAVLPRAGRAVVTNRTSGNASVLDLVAGDVDFTVTVGTEPLGVAINQDTGIAVVANNGSGNITTFSSEVSDSPASLTLNAQPVAVAIDPTRNLAAVAHAGNASNAVVLVNLSPTLAFAASVGGAQMPTGVTYDPVSDRFLAVSSLTNNLLIINPDTGQITLSRVGINPTSVAYNFNSSTLVTVNTASRTISVMDFLERRIRAILPITAGDRFAVAVHPRTNLAVLVDEANNRVLLLPLPR